MSFAQSDRSDMLPLGCTVDTEFLFSSGAPSAATSSQGWLSDPSQWLQEPDLAAYYSHSNDALSASLLCMLPEAFLEQIRNICGIKTGNNLHLELIAVILSLPWRK